MEDFINKGTFGPINGEYLHFNSIQRRENTQVNHTHYTLESETMLLLQNE